MINLSSAVIGRPQGVSELCAVCVGFITWIASPEAGDYKLPTPRPGRETCSFCEMNIEAALPYYYGRVLGAQYEHSWTPLHNLLSGERLTEMEKCSSSRQKDQLRISKVTVQGDPAWYLVLAVWADEGSPACKTFVSRPPILGPHMNDVCALARSWLNECKGHAECPDADETALPTRILALSRTDHNSPIEIRLVESNGRKGRYIALSHCWGSAEKPLSTTRDNLHERHSNIPFDQLGKTFQDVVTLAYGSGINLVWIDSLCILQGDNRDWHSEALMMRNVYRNAALVVLASGARDGSEGLFVTDRKPPIRYRLPYIQDGVRHGAFNLAVYPPGDINPTHGHLHSRAWALQERRLARRIMAFTRGGISWQCEVMKVDESGHDQEFWWDEDDTWLSLLESYTKKDLTYSSDRIEALQGVVAEFSTYRSYREALFHSELGVWEHGPDGLERQLLWKHVTLDTSSAPLTQIPTWSWAATGGEKVWVRGDVDRYREILMSGTVRITSPKVLYARGNMTTREMEMARVPAELYTSYARLVYDDNIMYDSPNCTNGPARFIFGSEARTSLLGVAIFDEDHPMPLAKCFFMLKRGNCKLFNYDLSDDVGFGSELPRGCPKERDGKAVSNVDAFSHEGVSSKPSEVPYEQQESIGVPDAQEEAAAEIAAQSLSKDSQSVGDGESPSSIGIDSASRFRANDGAARSKSDNAESVMVDDNWKMEAMVAQYRRLEATVSFRYWALLLDPVGDNRYKRVGIAMLYPHAYKVLGVQVEDFGII